ncbi:glutathione S-transferase [Nemania sp. FL0916]|nr:glutathione S-transferase [Nemania sp. FL0916]
MAPTSDLPIVLYHYYFSPYSKRVIWYLQLRKIPFRQCVQPLILPRPDLALLGVSYRRIPILSIGRDVYLDSRLILQKLETLYPPSAAHPGISTAHCTETPEHAALEQLLSDRVIGGGLFARAVHCAPPAAFANTAFQRDRAALHGTDMSKPGAVFPLSPDALRQQRLEGLAAMREWVCWLEEGLLADGRTWILGLSAVGGGPSLADIEAIWVLEWISGMPGGLPSEILSSESAPKVTGWIKRFDDAVRTSSWQEPSLTGEDAAKLIVDSPFGEQEGDVRREDPVVDALGLHKGMPVKMWPTDYGSSHKDTGKLVAMDDKEIVMETKGPLGHVRIHAPRQGFMISGNEMSKL